MMKDILAKLSALEASAPKVTKKKMLTEDSTTPPVKPSTKPATLKDIFENMSSQKPIPVVGKQGDTQQTGAGFLNINDTSPAGLAMQKALTDLAGQGKAQIVVPTTPQDAPAQAGAAGVRAVQQVGQGQPMQQKVQEIDMGQADKGLSRSTPHRGKYKVINSSGKTVSVHDNQGAAMRAAMKNDDYSVKAIKEKKLDEISKKTVGDYIKQAHDSASSDAADAGSYHRAKKDTKLSQRTKGIDRAVDKLTGKAKVPANEGAKVDRMVKHIEKSEKKSGKSKEEAQDIAWATANKRGMLDNKNKKKVEEGFYSVRSKSLKQELEKNGWERIPGSEVPGHARYGYRKPGVGSFYKVFDEPYDSFDVSFLKPERVRGKLVPLKRLLQLIRGSATNEGDIAPTNGIDTRGAGLGAGRSPTTLESKSISSAVDRSEKQRQNLIKKAARELNSKTKPTTAEELVKKYDLFPKDVAAIKKMAKELAKDKVEEGKKPDFLDLDKDGNKKESMKKAAADKKKLKENEMMTSYFVILDDNLIDQIAQMDGAVVDPDAGTVSSTNQNTVRQLNAFAQKNPNRLKKSSMVNSAGVKPMAQRVGGTASGPEYNLKENKKKVKESMNHRISAARLEGKSHGLRGHAHSGKRYEDLDEMRAYHEGFKEGMDELYEMGMYENAPAATVPGMAEQEMEEGIRDNLKKAGMAAALGATALGAGGMAKGAYDYHHKEIPGMGMSQGDFDKSIGNDPASGRKSYFGTNTNEDEFGEGNAFTDALAKTPKGGKFTVGGKTYTDRTNYDSKVDEYAFEAWDRELQNLLNEGTEVNEGLSVSVSKGQQNSPDSVTITAQDAEADQLLQLVKHAGLGLFGDEPSEPSSAMSVQPSMGEPDEVGAGGVDVEVVDGNDGIMGLMQKLSGIQAAGADDYEDEEGSEEQLHGNQEDTHEENCMECGGMMEAGHSCGSKMDEEETPYQEEFEVAEDNAPDSDEAETSADEDAEAEEDKALAGAASGDEEEIDEGFTFESIYKKFAMLEGSGDKPKHPEHDEKDDKDFDDAEEEKEEIDEGLTTESLALKNINLEAPRFKMWDDSKGPIPFSATLVQDGRPVGQVEIMVDADAGPDAWNQEDVTINSIKVISNGKEIDPNSIDIPLNQIRAELLDVIGDPSEWGPDNSPPRRNDYLYDLDEEQLDELSPKTLGSYINKAASDVGEIQRHITSTGTKSPDYKNLSTMRKNRKAGISRAVDKMTAESELNEWANDAGKKGTDASFEQDIEFMTKVISGGLNKPKSTGQTTVPVIAGQEDRMSNPREAVTESVSDWVKLAGIKKS